MELPVRSDGSLVGQAAPWFRDGGLWTRITAFVIRSGLDGNGNGPRLPTLRRQVALRPIIQLSS